MATRFKLWFSFGIRMLFIIILLAVMGFNRQVVLRIRRCGGITTCCITIVTSTVYLPRLHWQLDLIDNAKRGAIRYMLTNSNSPTLMYCGFNQVSLLLIGINNVLVVFIVG